MSTSIFSHLEIETRTGGNFGLLVRIRDTIGNTKIYLSRDEVEFVYAELAWALGLGERKPARRKSGAVSRASTRGLRAKELAAALALIQTDMRNLEKRLGELKR